MHDSKNHNNSVRRESQIRLQLSAAGPTKRPSAQGHKTIIIIEA